MEWVLGVLLGVIILGYIYHRWKSPTEKVIEDVAAKVNDVIDQAKKK